MALDFSIDDATVGTLVDCPGPTVSLTELSVWAWIMNFNNTKVGGEGVCGFPWDGSGENTLKLRDNGVIQFAISRLSTDANRTSDTGQYVINRWYFIVGAWSLGGSGLIEIFIGDLETEVAEVSGYSSTTAGSLAYDQPTTDFRIGNSDEEADPSSNFEGKIACCGIHDSRITLDQMRAIQARPASALEMPDNRGFWLPGRDGLGVQRDLSGYGHHGFVQGNVRLAEHRQLEPRLKPPVGFPVGAVPIRKRFAIIGEPWREGGSLVG